MKQINVGGAKADFSRLLHVAEAGKEIVIARGGKPVARLVPIGGNEPGLIGLLEGKFVVPNDFDDPLPDDLLDYFEGSGQ